MNVCVCVLLILNVQFGAGWQPAKFTLCVCVCSALVLRCLTMGGHNNDRVCVVCGCCACCVVKDEAGQTCILFGQRVWAACQVCCCCCDGAGSEGGCGYVDGGMCACSCVCVGEGKKSINACSNELRGRCVLRQKCGKEKAKGSSVGESRPLQQQLVGRGAGGKNCGCNGLGVHCMCM